MGVTGHQVGNFLSDGSEEESFFFFTVNATFPEYSWNSFNIKILFKKVSVVLFWQFNFFGRGGRLFPNKAGQMGRNLQLRLGLINLRIKAYVRPLLSRYRRPLGALGFSPGRRTGLLHGRCWEVTGQGTASEPHTSAGPGRGEDRIQS